MSLRARVVALIGMVLLVSLLMGSFVAGYQVRETLSAELNAALGGARQTVAGAFEDLPKSDHAARDLRQLIATFDGNRHVQATLVTEGGRAAWVSRTQTTGGRAPSWFRDLLGAAPRPVTIGVPRIGSGFRAIVLKPIAEPDVGAAWGEFVGVVLVLAGSAGVGLILVYLVIGAAFRPLRVLATQFGRISTGDYSGRVSEAGPSELLSLQRGFNHMASELAGTTERNRQLTDQLLTIQDEERADIARDLHDEIGPHLFAVNMDAEMIAQLNGSGRHGAIPAQVRAIQSAVGHMQRQVRDLLGRLRPTRVTELGLNAAIDDLVRFWAMRRPDIAFHVTALDDETCVSESTKAVIYRVVQEAANNAVRHGNPRTIRIAIKADDSQALDVSISDDGDRGQAQPASGGLGLIGMRERVLAAGGSLTFGPNPGATGWTTAARFSRETAAPARSLAGIAL